MSKTEEKTIYPTKEQSSCVCSEKKLCKDPNNSSLSQPKTCTLAATSTKNEQYFYYDKNKFNSTSALISW